MSSELSNVSTGTVTQFDDAAGLGVITDINGKEWPFHCVSLSDGSRTIDAGASVGFREGFRVARPEAVEITRL